VRAEIQKLNPPTRIPNRGPFHSEDEALAEVVCRLANDLDPKAIWLFGSRASGTHSPDSDFDLLVVTKDTDGDAAFDYDRTYAPIKELGVGCDVVPCPESDFATEQSDPTSLCHHIVQTGKQIYDREAGLLLLRAR
jgi:predicted nucleotidyltransferase